MFGVQQAQGGPHSVAGQGATPQGARPTDLEAALLRARFQDGELVEVYQRGVLERRVEIVIESRPVYSDGARITGVFSWERNQIPNLVDSVRITALLLRTVRSPQRRRGSTEKGVRLVSGIMLVQIQSSAPHLDGVTERRPPLRGGARSPKVQVLVRFQVGMLTQRHRRTGGASWLREISTTNSFFETMSKRRRGYPSEAKVKRGTRIVHGNKLLEEKLGRNDLCPCGSGTRLKKCCLKSGHF